MCKLSIIFLVFHEMLAMKVQSVTLDWRLARCLVSKPALFLTYLSSMTGYKNYAVTFCVSRLQDFVFKSISKMTFLPKKKPDLSVELWPMRALPPASHDLRTLTSLPTTRLKSTPPECRLETQGWAAKKSNTTHPTMLMKSSPTNLLK